MGEIMLVAILAGPLLFAFTHQTRAGAAISWGLVSVVFGGILGVIFLLTSLAFR